MNENKKIHNHKECLRLLGSLSEYVDGELSKELCDLLEQHMDECENCRVVVDTLRKTVYLYHKTSESENLPSDMRRRLFKSLNLEDYVES